MTSEVRLWTWLSDTLNGLRLYRDEVEHTVLHNDLNAFIPQSSLLIAIVEGIESGILFRRVTLSDSDPDLGLWACVCTACVLDLRETPSVLSSVIQTDIYQWPENCLRNLFSLDFLIGCWADNWGDVRYSSGGMASHCMYYWNIQVMTNLRRRAARLPHTSHQQSPHWIAECFMSFDFTASTSKLSHWTGYLYYWCFGIWRTQSRTMRLDRRSFLPCSIVIFYTRVVICVLAPVTLRLESSVAPKPSSFRYKAFGFDRFSFTSSESRSSPTRSSTILRAVRNRSQLSESTPIWKASAKRVDIATIFYTALYPSPCSVWRSGFWIHRLGSGHRVSELWLPWTLAQIHTSYALCFTLSLYFILGTTCGTKCVGKTTIRKNGEWTTFFLCMFWFYILRCASGTCYPILFFSLISSCLLGNFRGCVNFQCVCARALFYNFCAAIVFTLSGVGKKYPDRILNFSSIVF